MKSLALLIVILMLTFPAVSSSSQQKERDKGYERIQELILSLENEPSINKSRADVLSEVLIWMANSNFSLIVTMPIDVDTTYEYGGELLFGFSYGAAYYAIEHFHDFFREKDKMREFNINACIRGFQGMIKWYQGIIAKKGDSAKIEVMENLVKNSNTDYIRKLSEEFVDKAIKERGYEHILIYI